MSDNLPFVRGQHAVLKLYQSSGSAIVPVYIPCKTWDISENATECQDDINGEIRSRLDKVTNYFEMSVDAPMDQQQVIEAYMAAQDADDNSQLPLTQLGAIQLTQRDGKRKAYLLQGMKVGPIKVTMSSRQDPIGLNLKIRFQYMKAAPAF